MAQGGRGPSGRAQLRNDSPDVRVAKGCKPPEYPGRLQRRRARSDGREETRGQICENPDQLRGWARRAEAMSFARQARWSSQAPPWREASLLRDSKHRDKESGPMKIRPLGDRILVKRVKEEEKTKGGIIIPDTAKEKPQEGKVVAVGKGKVTEDGKLVAPEVKAGDKILFGKYSGSEIKLEGEEHLILREDDILGVIEK